ncbi:two-component system sensor histidine kinase MtrB [Saccharothrix tamanrassetensis]|uniref:histidine kinase n=1 Tax=Saccharothrix tamanrassetensis TaxID=1051531 RepID=A0A841CUV6_9PSEU|nr:HAMP domain-containing sensor histidine kinase [Saccharothrix tamanrassetensis]MBB5960603.1 two-component system sensor histidine kinase MtrB [Saccharothrix tamanrassetensis]
MTWRPGLRAGIVLTVVVVTLVTTVAMALTTYHLQAGATRERFTAAAQAAFDSDTQQAHQFLVRSTDFKSVVDGVAEYMRARLGLTWALVNFTPTSGPVSVSRDGMYVPVAGTGWFPGQLPMSEVDQVRDRRGSVRYTVDTPEGSQLVIVGEVEPGLLLAEFYNTRGIDSELATLRTRLAAVAVLIALFGSALGVLAARAIQRRVRTAADAARRFGAGELATRLPVQGRDELAALAGSFNAMAQRLGESIEQLRLKDQQQRRFVADVAHDLRTPLASMVAAADGLQSPDAADRARSAELLGSQTRRLGGLVEDLLEMSRFDAGAAELRPEVVDLAALVSDAVEVSAPGTGIPVRRVGDVVVLGDPRRLHTIVRNLVTNAVRHGAPPVDVTVDGTETGRVRVTVADSGPGLPDDLTPVVFDRFVRGDRARSRTEGSGLGLAIAHENARLHGGTLEVANVDGAVFTLTVPRGAVEHEC